MNVQIKKWYSFLKARNKKIFLLLIVLFIIYYIKKKISLQKILLIIKKIIHITKYLPLPTIPLIIQQKPYLLTSIQFYWQQFQNIINVNHYIQLIKKGDKNQWNNLFDQVIIGLNLCLFLKPYLKLVKMIQDIIKQKYLHLFNKQVQEQLNCYKHYIQNKNHNTFLIDITQLFDQSRTSNQLNKLSNYFKQFPNTTLYSKLQKTYCAYQFKQNMISIKKMLFQKKVQKPVVSKPKVSKQVKYQYKHWNQKNYLYKRSWFVQRDKYQQQQRTFQTFQIFKLLKEQFLSTKINIKQQKQYEQMLCLIFTESQQIINSTAFDSLLFYQIEFLMQKFFNRLYLYEIKKNQTILAKYIQIIPKIIQEQLLIDNQGIWYKKCIQDAISITLQKQLTQQRLKQIEISLNQYLMKQKLKKAQIQFGNKIYLEKSLQGTAKQQQSLHVLLNNISNMNLTDQGQL